jgi:signal transduction histidine kinase
VASGVEVELDVDDTSSVSEEATALTWRVAQEAVRNALRHGRPSKLSVRVGVRGDTVSLDVVDDGVGFDPRLPAREGHLGLRGLRDLITESGSTLTVESAPGSGTAVRLETAR